MKRMTCECTNTMVITGFWFNENGDLILMCYCYTCMKESLMRYPIVEILRDIKEVNDEDDEEVEKNLSTGLYL